MRHASLHSCLRDKPFTLLQVKFIPSCRCCFRFTAYSEHDKLSGDYAFYITDFVLIETFHEVDDGIF
ncbi:hypothetical protein QR66_01645 [Chromobacterium piscinae]|nr:hypothetical protein QR66_01645 [Chromobacterium piscinae]